MPKRTDIKSILIIGAGPIVIGQACEFDYSGTQACKALKAEGYRIVLVNSNPATIMTDPELADATYIEPITPEIVAKIIEKERPDALLPTMGGQTALNTALDLDKHGRARQVRRRDDRRQGAGHRHGRGPPAVPRGDDPHRPRHARSRCSRTPARRRWPRWSTWACRRSCGRRSRWAAWAAASATTGRSSPRSSSAASTPRRRTRCWSRRACWAGRSSRWRWSAITRTTASSSAPSRTSIPWACTPATRITVAPALTLTDKEYQIMRNASIAVLREIGVETGGSNVQFAVNPADGRLVIIEMNPRVSRSSALASKATGLPDRQGRRQAGGGLHAGRARERHHRRRHARLLRAHHRLRRHQDPALRVREIPRRRAHADDVDEVGRRGDGDRAHLRRKPAEGAAGAGIGPHRARRPGAGGPRPGRRQERDPRRAGPAHARPHPQDSAGHAAGRRARADPRLLQGRSVVPRAHPGDRGFGGARAGARAAGDGRALPAAEIDGVLGRAPGQAGAADRGRGAPAAHRPRRAPRVQAHRHLRRRVRLAHRLHVLHLRAWIGPGGDGRTRWPARLRGRPLGPRQGGDPGRRAQPHRPGHRVRLLLLPRLLCALQGRHRDHHGQLQPRDGVDRLRHLRPAVFRAAHRRGRARDHRRGADQGAPQGRDRAVRRPDPAQARARAGGGRRADPGHLSPMPSTSPRTATASRRWSTASRSSSRRAASRATWPRRAASPTSWAIR